MAKRGIHTGDRYRMQFGLITTPFPRADYKSDKRNSLAVALWLKQNWMRQAKHEQCDFKVTLGKSLNPSHFSPADYDQCNLYLFGDENGYLAPHLVK